MIITKDHWYDPGTNKPPKQENLFAVKAFESLSGVDRKCICQCHNFPSMLPTVFCKIIKKDKSSFISQSSICFGHGLHASTKPPRSKENDFVKHSWKNSLLVYVDILGLLDFRDKCKIHVKCTVLYSELVSSHCICAVLHRFSKHWFSRKFPFSHSISFCSDQF